MHRDGRQLVGAPLVAIVDDDEDVRMSLDTLLVSHGYRTALFPDAETYLASDIGDEARCIVTDVQMPGKSGIELAKIVRENGGQPVILITAFPANGIDAQARAAGVRAMYRKPFDPDALIEEIRLAIGN